jgi:hypothetical protein
VLAVLPVLTVLAVLPVLTLWAVATLLAGPAKRDLEKAVEAAELMARCKGELR